MRNTILPSPDKGVVVGFAPLGLQRRQGELQRLRRSVACLARHPANDQVDFEGTAVVTAVRVEFETERAGAVRFALGDQRCFLLIDLGRFELAEALLFARRGEAQGILVVAEGVEPDGDIGEIFRTIRTDPAA